MLHVHRGHTASRRTQTSVITPQLVLRITRESIQFIFLPAVCSPPQSLSFPIFPPLFPVALVCCCGVAHSYCLSLMVLGCCKGEVWEDKARDLWFWGCSWALSCAACLCGWNAQGIGRAAARWAWHPEVIHGIVLGTQSVREVSQQGAQPTCCINGGL